MKAARLVALPAVAALLWRLPLLLLPRFFDADDAVSGLMGLAMGRGEFSAHYWGSDYIVPLDGLVAGIWLRLMPWTQVAVKLAPITLGLAAACWLALRLRAPAVAWGFALLPAPLAALASHAGGRNVTAVCGIATWILFTHPGTGAALLTGLVAGVGWWNEPTFGLYLLPPLAWWARARWTRPRGRGAIAGPQRPIEVAATVAGFALGILPHLLTATLRPRPEAFVPGVTEAVRRVVLLLVEVVPGLLTWDRPPAGLEPGYLLVGIVVGIVLVALAVAAHRRPSLHPGERFMLWCADGLVLAFPVAWLLGPVETYTARRYAGPLWPALAIWAGLGWPSFRKRAPRLAPVLLAGWLAATGAGWILFARGSAGLEVDTPGAIALLDGEHLGGAFANYWAAELITLDTRERILVAQSTAVPLRTRDAYLKLADFPRVGYLFNPGRFPEDVPSAGWITGALRAAGTPFRTVRAGGWTLVVPARPLPVALVNDFRLRPGREALGRKIREAVERPPGGAP